MASVVYYEASSERMTGKRAVMDVVNNRAKASGKSVCQVVKQKHQFSWWPSKPMKKYNKNMQSLLTEVNNHHIILTDEKYLFFYSGKKPKWAKKMVCKRIQRHNFCKLKGE